MVLCEICITNGSLQNCTFRFSHFTSTAKIVYNYAFCLFVCLFADRNSDQN